MKIEKEKLKKIISMYYPDYQYLKEIESNFPETKGIFEIGNTYYTKLDVHYLTAIETQYCLNQLGYASIYASLKENTLNIPGIKYKKILDYELFAFIQNQDINFRQMIPTNTPIEGTITYQGWFPGRSFHKVVCNFDFEDMSCYGSLQIALGPVE